MKNHWLTNKIVAKGVQFWTYEILDEKQKVIIPEAIITIDERPQLMVIEQAEVIEGGKKVWKPVCIVWEKFEATWPNLAPHDHIRLLEANGDAVGILRMYDKSGEQTEAWVMHGLKLNDIVLELGQPVKGIFTFHHALYLTEESVWKN